MLDEKSTIILNVFVFDFDDILGITDNPIVLLSVLIWKQALEQMINLI